MKNYLIDNNFNDKTMFFLDAHVDNGNIGKYYIGDKMDLSMPFIEHFAYMWYRTPLKTIQPNKTKIMSIMISEKLNAKGHKYRHILVQEILKTNLII